MHEHRTVEAVRSELSNQVANPFKHQREHCQKDFVAKKVQGILNRITPEKYETLSQQLVDLIAPHMAEESESTTEICKEVSTKIFEKAVGEPQNSTMYADLVQLLHITQQRLTREVRATGRPAAAASIRTLILNRCQRQFYSVCEPSSDPEEFEILHAKHRKRCQGNAKLVAEVYRRKLLPGLIIEEVIHFLVKDDNVVPVADRMEVLSALLTVAGPQMDWERPVICDAWRCILEMSSSENVVPRIRFLLQDLIKLRQNDWNPRRSVDSPKKLAEVNKDFPQPTYAAWHGGHY
jgi:translation initiation factor 4G